MHNVVYGQPDEYRVMGSIQVWEILFGQSENSLKLPRVQRLLRET